MPTYQVTTDKGTYQVDTQDQSQTPSSSQGSQGETTPTTGVDQTSNDLSKASSSLDNINNNIYNNTINNQTNNKSSVIDDASTNLAQFGKGIYENPISKLIVRPLDDAFNGGQAQNFYNNLPNPKGISQNISSGIG